MVWRIEKHATHRLIYADIGIYWIVPRTPTSSDVFNAIAEPRRRAIVDHLASAGSQEVGQLVIALGWSQPTVSKHLAVLRAVGVVAVNRRGQHRVYELNAKALRPVHEWVRTFERFWTHQLDRIKHSAERAAAALPNPAESARPDSSFEPPPPCSFLPEIS